VALTGDFAGLGRLEANLLRLAEVPSQASKAASSEIQKLVEAEYDTGSDATGRAWAPLRPATLAKGRTPPPLTATHAMRDGTKVAPQAGAGIQITFDTDYAVFHHTGTEHMEARPVAPTGAFPASWEEALEQACEAAVARRMGAK
jgi:hypothetical protein